MLAFCWRLLSWKRQTSIEYHLDYETCLEGKADTWGWHPLAISTGLRNRLEKYITLDQPGWLLKQAFESGNRYLYRRRSSEAGHSKGLRCPKTTFCDAGNPIYYGKIGSERLSRWECDATVNGQHEPTKYRKAVLRYSGRHRRKTKTPRPT